MVKEASDNFTHGAPTEIKAPHNEKAHDGFQKCNRRVIGIVSFCSKEIPQFLPMFP